MAWQPRWWTDTIKSDSSNACQTIVDSMELHVTRQLLHPSPSSETQKYKKKEKKKKKHRASIFENDEVSDFVPTMKAEVY
jgi:hypothetical protein